MKLEKDSVIRFFTETAWGEEEIFVETAVEAKEFVEQMGMRSDIIVRTYVLNGESISKLSEL